MKSEHRPVSGAADASGAATAPARQSSKVPNAREARTAELRGKYADGTYKVDARKVSAKIVDRHLGK